MSVPLYSAPTEEENPFESVRSKNLYTSYHLAYRVRLKILEKIIHYDTGHKGIIEGEQILEAIKCVLGEER